MKIDEVLFGGPKDLLKYHWRVSEGVGANPHSWISSSPDLKYFEIRRKNYHEWTVTFCGGYVLTTNGPKTLPIYYKTPFDAARALERHLQEEKG